MEITDPIANQSVLGIRGRLIIGFGIITAIFVATVVISIVVVTNTKNYSEQVILLELPANDALTDLGSQLLQSQASLSSFILTDNIKFKKEIDNTWSNIDKLQFTLDDLSTKYGSNAFKNWHELKDAIALYKATQFDVLNKYASSSTDKKVVIGLLVTNVDPALNKILDIVYGPVDSTGKRDGGLYDAQRLKLDSDTRKIIGDLNNIQATEYILAVIGIISAIIIVILTARGIISHINVFRKYSNKIASGDLRHTLSINSKDEIGQLGKDLNTMTVGLSAITKQITQSCHSMVSTLEEARQAVNTQSSGATEQASSINEITASLEEIEKSSSQTMEKAKALGEVSERTREKGEQGLDAVEQSIQGMKSVRDKVQLIAQTILELSNQTQQVGEITAVVNSLAQQLKMLALNASIEAAKAGEAGKGFSVVASEVKNLAEQSEQSTAQVQKILEDIRHATEKAVMVTEEGTKGVDHGTGLVEKTGEIVRSLSDVIHDATIASQQIEAAVRQEGIGIEQITAGMGEINQVTTSFVVSVKQTTEAIENLAQISKNLKETVDTYKT